MKSITYHILYSLAYAIALLPLRVLYAISDFILYPLMRHVFRYRVKLARTNIAASFPDKDDKWVDETADNFYHYLCDEFVECFKMLTISREEMMRRMRFENVEELRQFADKGQNVCVFLGHFGNWDWVSSLPQWAKGDFVFGQIYHALENEAADRLFLKIRSRWGAESIEMNRTVRTMMKYREEKTAWIIGFIADQTPNWSSIHHWLTFLNHPNTPVFTGAEKLGQRYHAAAFYLHITRESRGHYVGRFVKLTDDCATAKEWETTNMYFQALEENIRQEPHLWLWTHNRWKRTREFYMQYFDPKTGRRL